MACTHDGIASPGIPLLGCSPHHNKVQVGLWGVMRYWILLIEKGYAVIKNCPAVSLAKNSYPKDGVRGCVGPGHPAWGIQQPSFRKRSVAKCLKMLKIKRKKVMTLGIQDIGWGRPKQGRRQRRM